MEQQAFRELDRSLRKQKIIDIAVGLFHKQGYRTTTFDDIAEQLGITKAAIYHYVDSKEEILFIIYNQVLQKAFEETNRIKAMDLPLDAKLRLIIRNQISIVIKNLPLMSVFFTEETQLPEKYYRMVREKKKEYDRIIQKIIEEGISLGIFEDVDPRLLTYAINGTCNWIYKWYHLKLPYTPDKIAEELIRILERSYLCADRAKPPIARLNRGEKIEEVISYLAERWRHQFKEMMDLLEGLRSLTEAGGRRP